jgi:hypothetical protein
VHIFHRQFAIVVDRLKSSNTGEDLSGIIIYMSQPPYENSNISIFIRVPGG